MNGKIIKLDGTFFEPDDYSDGDSPPLHPNCRCTVVPIVADKYRLDYEPDVLKLGLVSILKRRGNFNHAGIPGHRGGSKPGGSSSSDQAHQQVVRERTTGLKKLSPKALRAVRSYVATRKGVQNTAVQNEKMLAEFLKGEHKGGRQPFDIKKGKHYIEVKTKIEGKIDKITIKGEAITKKDKLIKATKGSIGHTVVFDTRTNTIYYKKGYGSFWLTTMTKVKNMNGLKKYFK
jgi:hypothetical protein